MQYQCACDIAFKCGSTISATSKYHHDMTEITLKVMSSTIHHPEMSLYVYKLAQMPQNACTVIRRYHKCIKLTLNKCLLYKDISSIFHTLKSHLTCFMFSVYIAQTLKVLLSMDIQISETGHPNTNTMVVNKRGNLTIFHTSGPVNIMT